MRAYIPHHRLPDFLAALHAAAEELAKFERYSAHLAQVRERERAHSHADGGEQELGSTKPSQKTIP